MLFNMNYTIQNSSQYFENSPFQTMFKLYKNEFLIINANIRDMLINLDKLNLFLYDLEYTFLIIGITETWLRTYNVDCYLINGYSDNYNIRQNKPGGGVFFFVANILHNTLRKYIN